MTTFSKFYHFYFNWFFRLKNQHFMCFKFICIILTICLISPLIDHFNLGLILSIIPSINNLRFLFLHYLKKPRILKLRSSLLITFSKNYHIKLFFKVLNICILKSLIILFGQFFSYKFQFKLLQKTKNQNLSCIIIILSALNMDLIIDQFNITYFSFQKILT